MIMHLVLDTSVVLKWFRQEEVLANHAWGLLQGYLDGQSQISRRKSPKRGTLLDIFEEILRVPQLLPHPNFSIEVVFIQEEEVRRYDRIHGWKRRGWIIRLIPVKVSFTVQKLTLK